MNHGIQPILTLAILSSLIVHSSSLARADGGAVRLRQRAGGYQIAVFTSPTPFRAGPVDLALIDLRMPGLDGYALLERLPAGIPAIVITSVDPGGLPPRASGLLRKDQLTAERLRYAINRIKGAGDG